MLGAAGAVVHDVEPTGQQVRGTTCQRGRGGGRAEGAEVDPESSQRLRRHIPILFSITFEYTGYL